MRSQRGTVENGPVFVIVLILVVIGWANWPGGAPRWIGWTAGGLLALLIAAGILVHLLGKHQLRRMSEVARALGSELRSESHTAFGQTTTYHQVTYRRGGRTVTLDLTSGSTAATLEVPGGKAGSINARVEGGVEAVTAQEQDRPRVERLLDAQVRSNLERMERIGRDPYRAVFLSVNPSSVTITKHGRMSPRETLLFLNLCWPVLDRALAACFELAVAPPAKACANCGGACCATCDGTHAPECGCAPA
jgi:hypothetical protein